MNKVFIGVSVFLSLVTCFFLGSHMLLHGDFFYLSDQARDFTLVKDIVLSHKLTLIGTHSGVGGLFHGPLWLYLLIPFFIAGKGSPIVFTYLYILIPLATVLAGYVVGYKLYGKGFGVLVAFLLATNAILWGYISSTQAINVIPLLYIFFIYFTNLYIRGSQKALLAIAFLVGLSFQFETASGMALIFVALIVAFLNQQHRPSLKITLYSIVSFILSLSTFIIFDLRHHFLILISTLQLFSPNQGHKDYVSVIERVIDHLSQMRGTYESILFTPNALMIFITLISSLYFFLIFFKTHKVQKTASKEFFFYFLTPAFVYAFYMLYAHPIYEEYVLDLTVSLIFAYSFILVIIWKKTVGKIFVTLFLSVTIAFVGLSLKQTYLSTYKQNDTSGSYLNQKSVTDWIWRDAHGKPFGYFVYTPETFTYGMDYLFWWESSTYHLPSPVGKKLAITYLILYPPLANDTNAHAFWIKNTIHATAMIEKRKTFQGGIIVERIDLSGDTKGVDPNYYQNLIFR